MDGNKTRGHALVQSFMCETEPVRAAEQFRAVRQRFGTGRSTTQAQHIIQSFSPGEVTPEKAMEIAEELCHRLLQEQYQYVIAVHEDHEHIHAHIIVNNTNMITGKTFETEHNQGNKKDRAWAELRRISDELCSENNLSIIQNPEQSKGKSHWEWDMSRQGLSWKAKLKYAIDQVVKVSKDFDDFLLKCAEYGILVDYNPDHKIDLKYMLAEQKENNSRAKFTRAKTLGWYYETEQIKARIAQYNGIMLYTPKTKVRVISPKAEENKFIRDAIDRENMKITSKALNILAKYGVTVDEAKTSGISAFSKRVALVQDLNHISGEIKSLEERAETLRKYREVKPIHQEYMALNGRKKEKYKNEHSESLAEHYMLTQKILEWYPDGTTPSVEKFEKMIADLTAQRVQKNAEYKAVDQKARELSEAAREIEQYLRQERSRDQQKKRKRNDLE
ncbi:relaxase/mobilization nuclease domain-containing protein [Ruminococcus albus]|uniref:relaxase/mobilization nuclease domain-containing protein n=1 Tax=Ruminococcus albus TaxID=1264 RepID=UPI001FA797DA|nr:relaxase/mobilization nuclease domain-containing protein [Ruminococcus albus]